jgi:hypothetical protein
VGCLRTFAHAAGRGDSAQRRDQPCAGQPARGGFSGPGGRHADTAPVEYFAALVRNEVQRWQVVARQAGITQE